MDAQPIYPMQSAFARGEVSPRLFGRVDLTGWSQGLRTLRNARVSPEGCVDNRPGFGYLGNSLLAAVKSTILVPFTFSASQSYVFEIGNLSCQVFSGAAVVNGSTGVNVTNAFFVFIGGPFPPSFTYNIEIQTATPHGLSVGQNVNLQSIVGSGSFALLNGPQQVLTVIDATHFTVPDKGNHSGTYTSGGVIPAPLTFATPWATADLAALRWSQSADTLTVVHPKYPPYEIKRTSATSFTCLPAVYINGPFLNQNTDGVTFVYANQLSGVVTLTASAPIFNANHVGALFQLQQQDLSIIQPWEPSKEFNGTPIGQYRRASGKNYQCNSFLQNVASYATGSWIPSHSQGTQADGDGGIINGVALSAGVNWTYQDSGTGIVLITGFTDSTHVTGIVQPNYVGGPGLLPLSVVGGPVPAGFTVTYSGDGTTKIFSAGFTGGSSDPVKYFVTIGGVYLAPSMYSVTAGANITFLVAPAAGTNNIVITQIVKLGQTTFWAFGAFSKDQGYPSAASYFPDRLVLAATPQQPVGVFGSQTSQYHNFGVSNPIVASDAFAVFLNARQLNAINDLIPLSDLLVGTSNITWRLWPGSTGVALSPLAIASSPQSFYGQNAGCASALFGDSAIYPVYDGRRLRDLIYQFSYDKFIGQELTLYSRHLIPFGTTFQRLAYKPDPIGDLVLGLRSDGALLCCTYLREQQIVGWARWDTQGTFEDICVVPEFGSYGVYVITRRTINGQQVRYIEHLESREVTSIFDWQFMDCNITYDGRNTSAATMTLTGGTTWLSGDTGTVTASTNIGWATFLPTDVGNEIWVYDALGNRCRLIITAYVSQTVCTVRLKDPCPAASGTNPGLQGVPTSIFTFARSQFTGANQLAGMAVVAYADGNVLGITSTGSAPDGSLTVSIGGSLTLPNPCGVVQIGLTYLTDFETLPLNEQGQATIRMRSKSNPVIYIDVADSRNFLAGTDFNTMLPSVEREFETYTQPVNQQNGILWTRVPSTLDSECHSCIRQNMPLPITIRMHIPQVTVGEPVA